MLHIAKGEFVDENGRIVTLRGINFSADTKAPVNGSSSYVNTPCTLEEADEHFARLKTIGYNCIRFLYVWDALQPEHPDKLDEDYMEFAIALVRKAIVEYDFYVFMDPHQDIWSRFSGGSGAPIWTLYAVGFDPEYFHETHAAMLWNPEAKKSVKMQWASNYHRLVCQTMFTVFFGGPEYVPEAKINGVNVGVYLKEKFFWAIGEFMKRVNNANLGPKLLGWESMNEPGTGLIGYEDLSKFPKSRTYVKLGTAPTPIQAMLLGQGIPQYVETYKFTGFGLKRLELSVKVAPKRGTWLDKEKLAAIDRSFGWERSWPGGCIWEFHKIYDSKTQKLLRPSYFRDAHRKTGDTEVQLRTSKQKHNIPEPPHDVGASSYCDSRGEIKFDGHETPEELKLLIADHGHHSHHHSGKSRMNDYDDERVFVDNFYVRHWKQFSDLVKSVNPDWFQFMQAPVNCPPPYIKKLYPGLLDPTRVVYTPHFYDGMTLMLKRWRWLNVDAIGVMRNLHSNPVTALKFGDSHITQSFVEQFDYLKQEGKNRLDADLPFLMSEIGIPYDMNNKSAYFDGYWDNQIRAMNANLSALEKSGCNYTLWCYAIHNSHRFGDSFAGEDLSIWSRDDKKPELEGRAENGIRAAVSVIRPGPIAVAGEIVDTDFNIRKTIFSITIVPRVDQPSEFFVPSFHFPEGNPVVSMHVTHGDLTVNGQIITWNHGGVLNQPQTLTIHGVPLFKDALYSYFEGIHHACVMVGKQFRVLGRKLAGQPGHHAIQY